jgi:hypothetical protein
MAVSYYVEFWYCVECLFEQQFGMSEVIILAREGNRFFPESAILARCWFCFLFCFLAIALGLLPILDPTLKKNPI